LPQLKSAVRSNVTALETFTELKALVDNPHYQEQRQRSLLDLDLSMIDAPISGIIRSFSELPYCFPLQSCYGHFLYDGQDDSRNIEPLPVSGSIKTIEYRIAYIAICIENCAPGKTLLKRLERIPAIDPEYIQFGCAEWFWKKQINSYALQVEPKRHMIKDSAFVDHTEALHIEKIRNQFFAHLNELVQKL
jgi:hypothetical protein